MNLVSNHVQWEATRMRLPDFKYIMSHRPVVDLTKKYGACAAQHANQHRQARDQLFESEMHGLATSLAKGEVEYNLAAMKRLVDDDCLDAVDIDEVMPFGAGEISLFELHAELFDD